MQIHDMKAIKTRSKWDENKKKGQIWGAAVALTATVHSPQLVPQWVHSGAELQTHFLLARSFIKSSSVPAALPAWGLHLLQH